MPVGKTADKSTDMQRDFSGATKQLSEFASEKT